MAEFIFAALGFALLVCTLTGLWVVLGVIGQVVQDMIAKWGE